MIASVVVTCGGFPGPRYWARGDADAGRPCITMPIAASVSRVAPRTAVVRLLVPAMPSPELDPLREGYAFGARRGRRYAPFMAETPLSRAAYDRLMAELEDLTTRGRVEIARIIER